MIPSTLEAALNGWHVAARLTKVVDAARADVLAQPATADSLADTLGSVLLTLELIAHELNSVEVEL